MIQTPHPLIHPFSGWDMNRLVDSRAVSGRKHPFLTWEPFDGDTKIWTFIQLSDRDKDMFKVGGENVAASEIERVVMTLPGIEETAVVAKKDPMLEEVPVIFVHPTGGVSNGDALLEEQILSTCRSQLADFKVPRAVYFVDDFPRSTLEKIAKADLRRRLEGDRD